MTKKNEKYISQNEVAIIFLDDILQFGITKALLQLTIQYQKIFFQDSL